MESYLDHMVSLITKKNQKLNLARLHVFSITLAFPILFFSGMALLFLHVYKVFSLFQTRIIFAGFAVMALELITIGLLAIAYRSMTVEELALTGGSKNVKFLTDRDAKKAALVIIAITLAFQVFILWKLSVMIVF